jgi:hypothetical protein
MRSNQVWLFLAKDAEACMSPAKQAHCEMRLGSGKSDHHPVRFPLNAFAPHHKPPHLYVRAWQVLEKLGIETVQPTLPLSKPVVSYLKRLEFLSHRSPRG